MEIYPINFKPSEHGFNVKNFSLEVDKKTLQRIKKLAYNKDIKFSFLADKLIKHILLAGVCSGISCYTLLKYRKKDFEINDTNLYIGVLQARTLGRPFVKQSYRSYFYSPKKIMEILEVNLKTDRFENYPLLVFYPSPRNLLNFSYAHTVVPYYFKKGLKETIIGIYDSNYPGDNNLQLKINNSNKVWFYKDKESSKWRLTINYLGILTNKVNFIW